jgi:hypothetical protein
MTNDGCQRCLWMIVTDAPVINEGAATSRTTEALTQLSKVFNRLTPESFCLNAFVDEM